MATVTIDIPDNQVNRILDAFATRYNWNGVTPATKAAFAKAVVAKWIQSEVKNEEVRQAQLSAGAAITETTPS